MTANRTTWLAGANLVFTMARPVGARMDRAQGVHKARPYKYGPRRSMSALLP